MLRSKTISSLVSMLFAQLILISLVGAQEMRLDLNDRFEPLGGIASMEITLDKGVAPVSAIAIDIGFDTQVLSNPGAMVDSQIGPGTSTDRQLISSLISSGVFRIAIIPASLTQASLGAVLPDGLVATVTFNISSLAAPGTVTIVTNTPSASTPAGQTLPTVGRDGVVTIVDNHVDIAPLYTTGNVLVGANYGNGPSSSGMTLIMRLAGDNVIYVDEGSPVKYVHNPDNQGAGNDWIERGFDDSGWADGTSGVGFSDSDDNTTVPAGLTSIWTRYQFDAPNAAAIGELVLLADYGDQYIAWLNGVRIAASAGAPEGEPPAWDAAQDGVLVHAASGFAAGSPSESRWHSFDIEWTVVGFEFVEQLTERVLSLTSAEASPGEQVTVQLSISDATGLASGDILIEYNSSIVTVREIRSADLISEEDFVANKDVLGDLRFSIARAEGLPPGSGALANIELAVSANAQPGTEATLSFGGGTKIYHESGIIIPVGLIEGVVEVVGIKGDVNNDGRVRSDDVIYALRIAAKMMTPTGYQKWAADMDDDGVVGSDDAVRIIRSATVLAAPGKDAIAGAIGPITIALSEAHGVAGEIIAVPLKVDSIAGLAGGDICIAYDPVVLQVVDVSCDSGMLMVHNITESGIVRIAFAPTDRLSSNTLAEIRFNILSDDVSMLALKTANLYQPNALPIDSVKIDGRFASWAIPAEHTALLQSYPNPFNPDTWIPYQLAQNADVTIRIHDVTGQLIRILDLGHRPAGFYITKERAAYWNGENETGEQAASGVYFYIIQAGDFAATRKMLILK